MNLKPKKSTFMSQLLQREDVHLPKIGERVEGKIIGRKRSSVFVDLGPSGIGVILGREFYNASDLLKKLSLGDTIAAKVTDIDEEEGYIELSAKQAGEEVVWGKLKGLKEKQENVSANIIGANKGGLLANIDGIPAFLPASQLAFEHYPRVDGGDPAQILHELQKLVGKPLTVKIIDVDPREQKLIISERATATEILQTILKHVKPGDIIEGEVSGIVDFGAFVRFAPAQTADSLPAENTTDAAQTSPLAQTQEQAQAPLPQETPMPTPQTKSDIDQNQFLEGLIHISELDWKLIEHPSEVVKVGEKVQAKIIDITPDGRISLSLKALKEDPWKEMEKERKKGDVIRGIVVKFNPFGAFIKITPSVQGLIHISEFGSQKRMQEVLALGKEYDFKILLIDAEQHRMALGLVRPETPKSETTVQQESAPTDTAEKPESASQETQTGPSPTTEPSQATP